MKGKHFITLEDWSNSELEILLNEASGLKSRFKKELEPDHLKNETIFLMFFEQSTRTRNSMEAGITQLGGHAHFLDTSTMQISHGEVAKDTAIILSRYGHAIACRNCFWGIGNQYLNDMAKWATVPIINMQDDLYHPLQGIADLMTIREQFNNQTKRLKVSIIWAYATSHKKPISVPVSQVLLFPRFGMDVTLAYPEGYQLPDWVIEKAKKNARENGGSLTLTHDQDSAYKNADVVIPKNWGSWVTHPDDDGMELLNSNKGWKCTEERMNMTKENGVYMHALPADRENEVENSVIDGPKSIIYNEAENRLHTSKAIMKLTMGGNDE
jgi:ornithine carbamoyltransferase